METLEIGQVITTQKSGVTGKILEVVENPKGDTYRVRIETGDGERWTTITTK